MNFRLYATIYDNYPQSGGLIMDFNGFKNEDFQVFHIDGLEARMEALIERIRPKLERSRTPFCTYIIYSDW